MARVSIRLLIVDDHETVRMGLRLAFVDTGIEVLAEAATASAAVRLASEHEVDVVLLDLKLGPDDGFDVLRAIRGIKPDLPVLIYSLFSDARRIERGQALGANGYVAKDAGVDALVRAIHRLQQGGDFWESDSGE